MASKDEVVLALESVRDKLGPFKRDPLEHAAAVIDSNSNSAQLALAWVRHAVDEDAVTAAIDDELRWNDLTQHLSEKQREDVLNAILGRLF